MAARIGIAAPVRRRALAGRERRHHADPRTRSANVEGGRRRPRGGAQKPGLAEGSTPQMQRCGPPDPVPPARRHKPRANRKPGRRRKRSPTAWPPCPPRAQETLHWLDAATRSLMFAPHARGAAQRSGSAAARRTVRRNRLLGGTTAIVVCSRPALRPTPFYAMKRTHGTALAQKLLYGRSAGPYA